MINQKIAATLKRAREKSGLTQLEVSKKLTKGGSQFVHLIETAKSRVPFKTLGQLVEIYSISQDEQKALIRELVNDYKKTVVAGFNEGRGR